MSDSDLHFMQMALELARAAEEQGEVPVGALVVINDEVIGVGSNAPIALITTKHQRLCHF